MTHDFSMIGIGWVWFERLGGPVTGRLIRLACGQPLASKCRVEPTVSGWGLEIDTVSGIVSENRVINRAIGL